MIPGSDFALEQAAADLRRRAPKSRAPKSRSRRRRAAGFTPPEWPRSRGPTPSPRHP
jgi:hypothetical protein